ncbi:MAG TPA: DUF2905 domain-containing protein [Bryobacteraceae bacterium]|nr:DUF2905 domain-containing protein [Bryobacteraceae bacterium]
MPSLGRTLILIGAAYLILGMLLLYGKRLPGDVLIKGKHWVFYFPLATGLLLSLVLSLVLWLLNRR